MPAHLPSQVYHRSYLKYPDMQSSVTRAQHNHSSIWRKSRTTASPVLLKLGSFVLKICASNPMSVISPNPSVDRLLKVSLRCSCVFLSASDRWGVMCDGSPHCFSLTSKVVHWRWPAHVLPRFFDCDKSSPFSAQSAVCSIVDYRWTLAVAH